MKAGFKTHLVAGTTMALSLLTGYARRAYAIPRVCYAVSPASYRCYGGEIGDPDLMYVINNVSVESVFGGLYFNTPTSAITLVGNGALSLTDERYSHIQSGDVSVFMMSTGDAGLTPGSIDIDINGNVLSSSSTAIYARNMGAGHISITTEGDVVGGYRGVQTIGYGYGTDITVGVNSLVEGLAQEGINVRNRNGNSNIFIHGDVSGGSYGMVIENRATANDLNIYTAAGSTVSGGASGGINAINTGTGNLTIGVYGYVYGYTDAIKAENDGDDLIITMGSDTYLRANGNGIRARHKGAGILSVTVDGDIRSNDTGIYLYGTGTDVSLITDTDSLIDVQSVGMVITSGTGDLVATLNGDIQAGSVGAVLIGGSGATGDMIINIEADAEINASLYGSNGVVIAQFGGGGLSVTHHGYIRANGASLYLQNSGAASAGLLTDGVIISDTGNAIQFGNYTGLYLTTATPLEIAGGRIVGDVMDYFIDRGLSPVTVTGDFTSEGSFFVSDFNIASTSDFTLSAGNVIESFSRVDIDGSFTVAGAGSSITGDVLVDNSGVFTTNGDFAVTGDLTNNGSIQIAPGANMTVNTMSAGVGSLIFGFDTAANHAQLTVTNGAANLTGQNIDINVTGVTGLAPNEQALLVTGQGSIIGGPGGTRTAVNDSSILWDFQIVDGTNAITNTSDNDLFLISSLASSVNFLAYTPNNENVGEVLMTLQATPNPELSAIVGNMNGASTQLAFNNVLEASQPIADGSEHTVLSAFTSRMTGMAAGRMDDLRGLGMTAEEEKVFGLRGDEADIPQRPGMQAWAYRFGEPGKQNAHGLDEMAGKEWGGAFGTYSRQTARDGIDGFTASSGGVAFGIDTGRTFPDLVMGGAVGYGYAKIDSDNINRAENEINGFQIIGYTTKTFRNDYYGELKAVYAQNGNDTTRHDVGGTPGLTAEGSFTSREMGLQAGIGRNIVRDDYLFAPEFSIDWLHYMADSYTETGAGGANLSVETKDLDNVEIGGSFRVVKSIKRDDGGVILPEMRLGYAYNLSGDPLQKTVQFAGGGAAFAIESPDPSRHRINIGAGVTYKGTGNWDYALNYDLDLQEKYQGHNLMAKAAWRF